MVNIQACPICNSDASAQPDYNRNVSFFTCPVCGRFEYGMDDTGFFDENHLSSYLFYNGFTDRFRQVERRYHTSLSKEKCDEYKKRYEQGDISHGLPVHMDSDIVEAWYPKTFAERIDKVLLYISTHTEHIGQPIKLPFQGALGLLFVDRKESDAFTKALSWRKENDCQEEARFLLDYLLENGLIKYSFGKEDPSGLLVEKMPELSITLSPKGYSRVDEIQKASSYGRNALVAMSFADDTIHLREAIRKGITDAGYMAIFIDEVQHNDFITPELLKHIRDSRFVVADLTHQNNGAYFEEGYAMGLGKPVIQLCQKGIKLHFDIAQKNTIMWETEDDIPSRLTNRIKATID